MTGDSEHVPIATPSRAMALFWAKDKVPKPHINPMAGSSATTTPAVEGTATLERAGSSTSIDTSHLESGWRYNEHVARRDARRETMAEAVPGDAPPYTGPSILSVPDGEGSTLTLPDAVESAPVAPISASAPPCVPEVAPSAVTTAVAAVVHSSPEQDMSTTGMSASAPPGTPQDEQPVVPEVAPPVTSDVVAAPAPEAAPPAMTSNQPVRHRDESPFNELVNPVPKLWTVKMANTFADLCEGPQWQPVLDRYNKMDQRELDVAIEKAKAHPSCHAFECYVTICSENGKFGRYTLGTDDLVSEVAAFELWLRAETMCADKPDDPATPPPAASQGPPMSVIRTVLTRATTVDLARTAAASPPAPVPSASVEQPVAPKNEEPEVPAPATSLAKGTGSVDILTFICSTHRTGGHVIYLIVKNHQGQPRRSKGSCAQVAPC